MEDLNRWAVSTSHSIHILPLFKVLNLNHKLQWPANNKHNNKPKLPRRLNLFYNHSLNSNRMITLNIHVDLMFRLIMIKSFKLLAD
jgi:hypothetical protein